MTPSLPFAGTVCKLILVIFCLCLVSVCTLAQGSSSQGATQSNNTAGPQPPSGIVDGKTGTLQAYGQYFYLMRGDVWTTKTDGTVVINHTEFTNGKIDPHTSFTTTVQPPESGRPTTSTQRYDDGHSYSVVGVDPNDIVVELNPTAGGFSYKFAKDSRTGYVAFEKGFVPEPPSSNAADNALAHVLVIAQSVTASELAPLTNTQNQGTPRSDPSGLDNKGSNPDDIIKQVEKSLAEPSTGAAPSDKLATPVAPNGVPTTSGTKTTSDTTQTKPYLQVQLQPHTDTINPPPTAGADKPGESVNISPLKVELEYKPNPSSGTGVRIATKGVPDASTTGQPATGAAGDFSDVNTANLPKSSGKVDFPPLASGYKSKSLANGGLLVENPEHQEFYYYLDGHQILRVEAVGVAPSSSLASISSTGTNPTVERELVATPPPSETKSADKFSLGKGYYRFGSLEIGGFSKYTPSFRLGSLYVPQSFAPRSAIVILGGLLVNQKDPRTLLRASFARFADGLKFEVGSPFGTFILSGTPNGPQVAFPGLPVTPGTSNFKLYIPPSIATQIENPDAPIEINLSAVLNGTNDSNQPVSTSAYLCPYESGTCGTFVSLTPNADGRLKVTATVRPGTLKIIGPIDIIPHINLNDLIQNLIRFDPSQTGSSVPGVPQNLSNQPEKSPTIDRTGTSPSGSGIGVRTGSEFTPRYSIDFHLRYSRFQDNPAATTGPDATAKPDSSSTTNQTPSPSANQKGHISFGRAFPDELFRNNRRMYCQSLFSLPPSGPSSTQPSNGTETNCVNAFGPDPGSLRVFIKSPAGVVFNPLTPHTFVCPIQGATLLRSDKNDFDGIHFTDCLPTSAPPSQIADGSAVFTIGPSTEGLGVTGSSTERAATNEGGAGAGGGLSVYPGFPAISAANSLLYGNLPVSLIVQITVVGEKVVVAVSPTPNTSPSSTPGNASRLNPPQRSKDTEQSSSSDLGARFRLASYRERRRPEKAPSRGPAVTPPAEGLIFWLASTGKLGTGAFEFTVHDPSGKLKNIELPEGTVLEPLNMGVPGPAGAPGGSDVTKNLTAFCLEIDKLPPNPNQLYRIASPALQEKYKSLTPVIHAGSKLAAEGKFHPDSEPEAYNDFTRQHAAWAAWLHWTEQEFTKVFLERTKKNLEQMNLKWTKETEKALLAAAPGRWRDIRMVLEEAEKLSNQSSR